VTSLTSFGLTQWARESSSGEPKRLSREASSRTQRQALCARRPHLGALPLGCYSGRKLLFASRVGTGMSQRELARLRQPLEPLAAAKMPLGGAAPPTSQAPRSAIGPAGA
jgi:hypothetical protein